MLKKLILFNRFPRFFWKKGERDHVVDPTVRGQYPALAEDFALLDKYLMDDFWELDEEAMEAQNKFRRAQVILILGTLLATIFGAIQAANPDSKWPGLVETVLAALMAAVIMKIRTLKTHEGYYTNRLKAERLRGEYFLFLGRAEPYSNDNDRVSNLVSRVAAVITQEEVK